MNLSRDNFLYAMETSRVLHEPDRRIATFGETRFEFQLISELMDRIGEDNVCGSLEEALGRARELTAAKP